MITADHGNAEQMFSEQGGPHTAHTTNRGTFMQLRESTAVQPAITKLWLQLYTQLFPTRYHASFGVHVTSLEERNMIPLQVLLVYFSVVAVLSLT